MNDILSRLEDLTAASTFSRIDSILGGFPIADYAFVVVPGFSD